MTGPDPTRQALRADAAIDDIERDIERTRQELGETVSALSDKLDVKSRLREKARATKDAAAGKKVPLAVDSWPGAVP